MSPEIVVLRLWLAIALILIFLDGASDEPPEPEAIGSNLLANLLWPFVLLLMIGAIAGHLYRKGKARVLAYLRA